MLTKCKKNMLYCLYDNFQVNKYKNINSKIKEVNNNNRILSVKGELKMSDKQNSLLGINRKTVEVVKKFPYDKGNGDDELIYKIDEMCVVLDNIYIISKKELSGIFELNEAYLIIQSFNGCLYIPKFEDKEVLRLEIEDAIFYEKLDELFEVNKDKLLQKINKLTEAQSFAVIRMVFEALNNEENKNFDELVKEIFGIK